MLKAQIVDENGARVLESETGSVVAKVYNILMDGAAFHSSVTAELLLEQANQRARALEFKEEQRQKAIKEITEEKDYLQKENDALKYKNNLLEREKEELKELIDKAQKLATKRLQEIEDLKGQLKLWQSVAKCKEKTVVKDVEQVCETCDGWHWTGRNRGICTRVRRISENYDYTSKDHGRNCVAWKERSE